MIKWEEKYSVGLSIIDEEHKELIRIMNVAIKAKQHNDNIDEISKLLKQLTVYTLKHFSTEESYILHSQALFNRRVLHGRIQLSRISIPQRRAP